MPIGSYLLSVPERVLRSVTALTGGLLREVTDVVIPASLRRTRLYGAIVDSTLRFLIEQVGEVENAYPSQAKLAEDFLIRRTAGNGIDWIFFLTLHASPVWVMAALADISGAGRMLIQEIAATLKKEGLLDPNDDFSTADQLLDGLEKTAAQTAETLNTLPLDVATLRKELARIRKHASSMTAIERPKADDLWTQWRRLEAEAAAQQRNVFELSALLALSAIRQLPSQLHWLGRSATLATRRTGEVFAQSILGHYARTLDEIHRTGYLEYWARELAPYWQAAAKHFSPTKPTLTERFIQKRRSPRSGS